MLAQIMTRHYGMITQLMQQAATAVLPKEIREYSIKVIESSDRLMKQILRHFDHDDVDALVPRALGPQSANGPQGPGGPQNATRQPTPFPSQPSLSMPVQPPDQTGAGILAGMVGGGEAKVKA